jgi:hypothetical protein
MVHKLDDATIMKILEIYENSSSISKTARTLGLSKGVVHKYVREHRSGRLDIPPLPSPPRVDVSAKTVYVNIKELITEHTLKTLHTLAVKEGFEGIDACLKELIDLYIRLKAVYEGFIRQSSILDKDKEHYFPQSHADYWFGFGLASIRGAAVKTISSYLDKTPETALNIASAVVDDIIVSQEFLETYSKTFRKWYDQSQDILLTAKAREGLPKEGPREVMHDMLRWVVQRAYPKAKASADVEPEE